MTDRELTRAALRDEPVESNRSGPAGTLARRWPTVLALLVSVPGFADPIDADGIAAFAATMLLLPLWYVVIEATGRRSWTWPVLVVGIGVFVLLSLQDQVAPAVVLAAIALAAVLWGTIRGRLTRPSFQLQVAGLAAVGALGITGLVLASDLGTSEVGRYVVAAGWFAHGLWDFAHHRADAGVRRSGAEWCGVVDVLVAAQLVVVPLVLPLSS